ncbi:MAG: hypothetical protein LBC84_03325 [Prevotellaceae bacterium]|jgi:hypothetical protein|nr:hypothetical protein [Prevotellaceae bacterium]
MKRNVKIVTLAVWVSSLVLPGGCTFMDDCFSGTLYVEDPNGKALTEEVTFPWEGGPYDVYLVGSTSWKLVGLLPDWIEEVTPLTGGQGSTKVTLVAKVNDLDEWKYGTLTFVSVDGSKYTLLLRQEPTLPPLFSLEGVDPDTEATVTFTSGSSRPAVVNILREIPILPGENVLIVESVLITGKNSDVPILIGRRGERTIFLKFDGGNLVHRDPAGGSIPIGAYAEFQLINTITGALAKSYKQEADLYLMNKAWDPVGRNTSSTVNSPTHPFVGIYDGDGKSVFGLYIDLQTTNYVGLFGYVGHLSAGLFGTVKNLFVSGTVTGRFRVGGIVGYLNASRVENCGSAVAVTGVGQADDNGYVGGVVGQLYSTSSAPDGCVVVNCYATGDISGYRGVGGVAGLVNGSGSEMTKCYSTGAVSGNNSVGGVTGIVNSSARLTNNVALNQYVYGTGSNVGRVLGSITGAPFSGIAGNFVWENLGTNGGIAFGGGGGITDGHQNIGILYANPHVASGYPWDVTAAPWTYLSGDLPGLFGQTVAMPAHLQ